MHSPGGLPVEEILQTPFLLFETVDEMAAQIAADRERYGFTYYSVHAPVCRGTRPLGGCYGGMRRMRSARRWRTRGWRWSTRLRAMPAASLWEVQPPAA
jgi:hypothetical protein